MKRVRAWACCAALPAFTAASDWQTIPTLSVGVDADSNRRLQVSPHASESAVLAGTLSFARLTEISQFALTPHVQVSRYSGEDALDSDDYGTKLLWRRNGERTVTDLAASYSNASTLVSELGETGFVEGNTRRTALNASVSVAQYVATRHVLRYEAGASDIDYQRTRGAGLVGYRYPNAGITWLYSATQRLTTTFALTAARLEAPEIDLVNETRGAQVGLRFRMSERLDFEASVGGSTTTVRSGRESQQSYHAGISWHDERTRFELTASRDVEPSGRGVLVDADDLRVAYSRDLTERLTFDGSLRASRRADLAVNPVRGDYEYGVAVFALGYRVAENWTVSLAGVYSRQDLGSAIAAATGTRIGLVLNWQPPRE